MLSLPIALRFLIDNGLSSKSTDTINLYFIAFLAAAGAFGVFAALRFYLVTWLGERVVADMRSAVYARVIRMDPAFFESHPRRRGAVAPDRGYDAGAVDRGRQPVDHVALDDLGGGQPRDAGSHQPEAHRDPDGADPAVSWHR